MSHNLSQRMNERSTWEKIIETEIQSEKITAPKHMLNKYTQDTHLGQLLASQGSEDVKETDR